MVIYIERRTDLLQPVFFNGWLGPHRALADQLPGVRQYTISLAADVQDGAFNGVAELWLDDLAAAYVTLQTWAVDGGVSIKSV